MCRRPLLALPLLALLSLACASSSTEAPRPGQQETNLNVQMRSGQGSLNLRTSDEVDVVHDTVPGEAGDLFSLLPAVYDELGVPITSVNPAATTLGALQVRARGDFAGERISRWFDCGTSITGDIADQRQINVTVLTQVESLESAGGSGVSTHVRAYATQAGRSGNRTDCQSRGRLERRINNALGLRASQGSSGDGGG